LLAASSRNLGSRINNQMQKAGPIFSLHAASDYF
jgi:hypothetical protein